MSAEQIAKVQERYGKGPHVTVDLLVVTARWTARQPHLALLLIERGNPPYQGCHALPGGFVELHEDLEQAARRELAEETGLDELGHAVIEQLGTFGDPQRDPRGRVISVVHMALVDWEALQQPHAADDAAGADWYEMRQGRVYDASDRELPLAFDHERVLQVAWERLQVLARYSSAPLRLLPEGFSLEQAQAIYELLGAGHAPPSRVGEWLLREQWIERVSAAQPQQYRAVAQQTMWASTRP